LRPGNEKCCANLKMCEQPKKHLYGSKCEIGGDTCEEWDDAVGKVVVLWE
jgi:hypothetical protein